MIARVRIAPIERWCKKYTPTKPEHWPIAQKLVGMEVEIYTESMRPAICDPEVRMWNTTPKMEQVFRDAGCLPTGGPGMCEHILEMD